jgi:hypothetical protein
LDCIREYEINLSEAEDNPNGFTIYLLPTFQFENKYVEAIVLTKIAPNLEDMIGPDKISVPLLECGTKFLVQEPSVSRVMTTNYSEAFNGFAPNVHLHENVLSMHVMLLSQIDEIETRCTKRYFLKLLSGYKCKMGYLNPASGERLSGVLHYSTTNYHAGCKCHRAQ